MKKGTGKAEGMPPGAGLLKDQVAKPANVNMKVANKNTPSGPGVMKPGVSYADALKKGTGKAEVSQKTYAEALKATGTDGAASWRVDAVARQKVPNGRMNTGPGSNAPVMRASGGGGSNSGKGLTTGRASGVTEASSNSSQFSSNKLTQNKSNSFIQVNEKVSNSHKSGIRNNVEINHNFKNTSDLESHFQKHGAEFKGTYSSSEEYLRGANFMIKHGHKIEYFYKGEKRTGYVRFMGNSRNISSEEMLKNLSKKDLGLKKDHKFGEVKFEFLALRNDGTIATYHTQTEANFYKTINGNKAANDIKVESLSCKVM